jgi:hypothetical protein
MKRIMGIVLFPNMADAEKAMDALEDAGYEFNIRNDLVFIEAWRYVASDTDELAQSRQSTMNSTTSVDPFDGLADDVGVFAEGEPHDFYGSGDGTKPISFAQRQ